MILAAITLDLLAMYFFARFCAAHDADAIAKQQPINHVEGWIMRAAVGLAFSLGCGLPSGSLWVAALLCVANSGLFSYVFRRRLNRLRGFNVNYVAPGNLYDWTVMWLVGFRGGRKYWISVWSDNVIVRNVQRWVHRAGRLASTVEIALATLAVGLAVYLTI